MPLKQPEMFPFLMQPLLRQQGGCPCPQVSFRGGREKRRRLADLAGSVCLNAGMPSSPGLCVGLALSLAPCRPPWLRDKSPPPGHESETTSLHLKGVLSRWTLTTHLLPLSQGYETMSPSSHFQANLKNHTCRGLTEAGGADAPLLSAANHTEVRCIAGPWLCTGSGG